MPQKDVIFFKSIKHGYALKLSDVVKKLKTDDKKGLKDEEANIRLEAGTNEIITPSPSIWSLYLAPLFDVLIVIYLIMTVIMLVLSIFVSGIASKVAFWIILIAFNMALAIFQQFRAQKKIDALQKLSPPMSVVIRNGKEKELEAKYLVPGDLIKLSLGDRIPADARIVSSSNLSVNESSLTGESVPVSKYEDGANPLDPETPISEHKNMLYLGTFIQTGNAYAIVIKTGNDTELGKIASAMSDMNTLEIPLRKRINALGKTLGILMVIFLLVLVIFTSIQRFMTGINWTFQIFASDLAQSIINAMAVIPINIPLLTTVVLITGVLNMASNRVVIKELSVIETLGRCSVLCSDKTGTMTTAKMTCKLVYDTDSYYYVWLKNKHQNAMSVVDESEALSILDKQTNGLSEISTIKPDSSLELLLTSAILNNEAHIIQLNEGEPAENAIYDVVGNPTDGALVILAKTKGLDEDAIRNRYSREKAYPFDSNVKRMSGQFYDKNDNDHMVFSKGATSLILERCTKIGNEENVKKLTAKKKKDIENKVDYFANNGYRVISLAYKPIKGFITNKDKDKEREEVESELIYIGFAIIYDPPRTGVYDAVKSLDSAGIFPIMITGDALTTAGTIARQVGVLDPDEMVVEGKMAGVLDDKDFFKVSVFARVSPQDKEIIVSRYQNKGAIVAMTGDGVNDALAITKSDAGIAMGQTGTEVTKEAADIIITDDSYVSLVKGVEEGRNLYEKIRMMVFFYIAVNLAEAIMYFSASFKLDFYILNNWQRVYIFGIIHAIPVLAIIFGPSNKNIMNLKPRDNDAILPKRLVIALVIFGLTLAITVLTTYFIFYNGVLGVSAFNKLGIFNSIKLQPQGTLNPLLQQYPETIAQIKARTMLITVIYLAESLLVLSIRRINLNIVEGSKDADLMVWITVLFGLVLHFFVMYVSPFQKALFHAGIDIDIIPLNFLDLIFVVIVASIPVLCLEGYKYYIRKSGNQF